MVLLAQTCTVILLFFMQICYNRNYQLKKIEFEKLIVERVQTTISDILKIKKGIEILSIFFSRNNENKKIPFLFFML